VNMRNRPRPNIRSWIALVAMLGALLPIFSVEADSTQATVTLSGTIVSKLTISPCGTAGLVTALQNGKKDDWYYVYAVKAGTAQQAKITVGSNAPWTGLFAASALTAKPATMRLDHDALRYSTFLPTSFAQADAQPALSQNANFLGGYVNPAGAYTYTHYYLLHVKNKPAQFYGIVTYAAGQYFPFFTALCQVTISYP